MANERDSDDLASVEPGEGVYDEDGQLLGHVLGPTDDGFEVEAADPNDPDGVDQEEVPDGEFGEGYLMWRCMECGEMGELDEGVPETCPNCGAPREELTEVLED